MMVLANQGSDIKSIAFAPNGGWSLLSGINSFYNRGIPEEAHQIMQLMANNGQCIRSVAFAPVGWSILGE
jgi:hypothetical protein